MQKVLQTQGKQDIAKGSDLGYCMLNMCQYGVLKSVLIIIMIGISQ